MRQNTSLSKNTPQIPRHNHQDLRRHKRCSVFVFRLVHKVDGELKECLIGPDAAGSVKTLSHSVCALHLIRRNLKVARNAKKLGYRALKPLRPVHEESLTDMNDPAQTTVGTYCPMGAVSMGSPCLGGRLVNTAAKRNSGCVSSPLRTWAVRLPRYKSRTKRHNTPRQPVF